MKTPIPHKILQQINRLRSRRAVGFVALLALASTPAFLWNACSSGNSSTSSSLSGVQTSGGGIAAKVFPAGGALAGGNTITVSGSGFDSNTTVQVAGVSCPIASIDPSGNFVTCTVPASATVGWVSVSVTDNSTTVTIPNAYAYGAFALGQPDVLSRSLALGGSMAKPRGMVVAGGYLFVADSGSSRVLAYTVPVAVGAAPAFALGQTDLNAGLISPSLSNALALSISTPVGLCTDGTRLMISDAGFNRVTIYNQIPTSATTAPTYELGQPDFTGAFANQSPNNPSTSASAQTLSSPGDIYCDTTNIIVTDTGNNRVLVWNQPIAANDQAANVVIGQTSATANLPNMSSATTPLPLANSLWSPRGVAYDATNSRLYISDTSNHRLLVWFGLPTANGTPANLALGVKSLTSTAGAGCSQTGMAAPEGVALAGNDLYVVDSSHSRALVWDVTQAGGIQTWPNGQAALDVLGQTSFKTCLANQGGTPFALTGTNGPTLRSPMEIYSTGADLYISDSLNNRILYYSANPNSGNPQAIAYLGQSSEFNSSVSYSATNAGSVKGGLQILSTAGSVLLADPQLNRVLVFSPTPAASGVQASYALGQPDLMTSIINVANGSINAATVSAPRGLFLDSAQNLGLVDSGNNRVLGFNGIPSAAGPANLVVGQANFTSTNLSAAAAGETAPTNVCIGGNQTFVVDGGHHRILVYNATALSGMVGSGSLPAYVVGQSDITGVLPNEGGTPDDTSLWAPGMIYCDSVHLVVPDSGNHRVMVFNLPISESKPSADIILGQPDDASNLPNQGQTSASLSTMYSPHAAIELGGKLYVADSHNNRLLVWNNFPQANNQAADKVFGQVDSASVLKNAGSSTPDANVLAGPQSLASVNGELAISDSGNNRVLVIPAP